MDPKIIKADTLHEFSTLERCLIAENYSSKEVSIAQARVKPGITTKAHHLQEVNEFYIVTKGKGRVYISGLEPAEVSVGDVVVIPAGLSQKIFNSGESDLVFYCICTPRFTANCYVDEEAEATPP
jgi:mannose-6-phosphate isomerase-like protein (cupin superfamily)